MSINDKVYELLAQAASPVSLAGMRTYLKIGSSTADDALIQTLIDACTLWGENYTGRDFRVKDWKLLQDEFEDRIQLRRDPVDTITSVKHLVSAALATVDASVYYLKKLTQCSEILLQEDQSWPTNTDDREQAIEIEFQTEAYFMNDLYEDAIQRHVAFMYSNRGDCPDVKEAAFSSGVNLIYDQFRIERL